jgi:hypothetical protein
VPRGNETQHSLEEGVGQNNIIDVPTRRVVQYVLVNEEQERHIDFLSRQKFLLLEAETFNLGKVWRNLSPRRMSHPPSRL